MPKRGENIRKRKDGRWEGRYIEWRDDQGKGHYHSVYARTYREVKAKMLLSAREKEPMHSASKESMSFESVLQLWLQVRKVKYKNTTHQRYEYLIKRHIIPELGQIRISELTPTIVTEYIQKKLQDGRLDGTGGLSNAYVRSILVIISSARQFAVQQQLCKPWSTPVYKPPLEHRESQTLNITQQRKLEEFLFQHQNLTGVGVLLSLYTGLRIGEMCALQWQDIDLAKNILHVKATIIRIKKEGKSERNSLKTCLVADIPKTRASIRDIPIPSILLPVLKEFHTEDEANYVLTNQHTFMSPRTYEYRYHRIMARCEIKGIHYHALRHTFATRCIEAGVDMKSLSEMLGHANVSITLHTYVHSSMNLKREQMEKLSQYIRANS